MFTQCAQHLSKGPRCWVCACAWHIAKNASVIPFSIAMDQSVNTLDPVQKRLVPNERLEGNPLIENLKTRHEDGLSICSGLVIDMSENICKGKALGVRRMKHCNSKHTQRACAETVHVTSTCDIGSLTTNRNVRWECQLKSQCQGRAVTIISVTVNGKTSVCSMSLRSVAEKQTNGDRRP